MAYTLVEPTKTEALLLAHARLGHADELVEAAAAGASFECRGLHGTPLVEACRAEHCTQLHVLSAQWMITNSRVDVNATDWFGATALLHATLRCSVLPEAHLQLRYPAPGVMQSTPLAADSTLPSAGAVDEVPGRGPGRRASARYSIARGTSTAPTPSTNASTYDLVGPATPTGAFGHSAGPAETSAEDAIATIDCGDGEAHMGFQRPRCASDGHPRHIQLVMLLLNCKCDVNQRARNGVSVVQVLAASPSADAVATLEWVLERSMPHSEEEGMTAVDQQLPLASKDSGGASSRARQPPDAHSTRSSIWAPDSVGANIIHYAAYAANVDALKMLTRRFEEGVIRRLAGAVDAHGRTPLDVLLLYEEVSVLASPRTTALRRSGMYPEVPFEARRREFRTLLTTLL